MYHTSYVAPSQDSQGYRTLPQAYLEPGLVDETIRAAGEIPALLSPGQNTTPDEDPNSGWNSRTANSTNTVWANTSGGVDIEPINYLGSSRLDPGFMIDGRSSREEEQWWNPEERNRDRRPGSGILAPILAEELHDSNHSLFSVNITGTPSRKSPAVPSISTPNSPPPSKTELRTSIPHPNAYYCPKHNGWVILSWKSSPIPRSYVNGLNRPLPDPARRKRTPSCIEETLQPFGRTNRTHHFHKYEGAVDSHKLIPPFRNDGWEVEGKPLDLYVCCQCTLYCVASGVISGVVSKKYMDELQRHRRGRPAVGKSPEETVALTMETILIAIENHLFKGNNRNIKATSPGFQAKVGWNSNIKRIFGLLGFVEDIATDADVTLKPPSIDPSTPRGKQNRRKLLRAWVELGSWIADFKRANARHFGGYEYKLCVELLSARDMYQTAIGAHPDQIHGGGLPDTLATRDLDSLRKILGLTPTSYSPELLGFAYLAQIRCDPKNTPTYFTCLTNIVKALHQAGSCPPQLRDLVATERTRDRFTLEDVSVAATVLGFGVDNVLHVEYEGDMSDDFVENAWKDCVKRSWRDRQRGAETHRIVNESFRILAEFRGSVRLRAI